MSKIIQVVARNQNNIIGDVNGDIPWICKADISFFYYLSISKNIVCGRKTFEGLPEQVKNRVSAVFTRDKYYNTDKKVLHDLVDFKDYCDLSDSKQDILIIGGEQVYNLTYNITDEIYLTFINDQNDIKKGAKYKHELLKSGFRKHWVLNHLIDEKTGVKFDVQHWVLK